MIMHRIGLSTAAVALLFAASTFAETSASDTLNISDSLLVTSSDIQQMAASCGGEQACQCADCCGRWYLFPQSECGLNIQGWINGGVIGNTSSPGSHYNGPYNAVDRADEPMMNQLYFIAEQGLPYCGIDFGGRLDFMYGEDYFLAESFGLEKHQDGSGHWNREFYGIAFPQAYVAVGNQNLNVQVGHFYSVVGYEGVMAPDNFFYSKALSYQFASPFTYWGGQVNFKPNNVLTIQLGAHNGWDALDRVSDDIGFVGKVRYDFLCNDAWTSFAITTGKEFNDSAGVALTPGYSNRTRYSWIVNLPLTCNLEYVFHQWLGFQDRADANGRRADWYGLDQYLYYTINDCWKAGLRFEWFRDDEGTRVGLNRPTNPNTPPFIGNFYSASVGLNWSPTDNLMVRPEVRGDWYDGPSALPFDDGNDDSQILLGIDAILRF